MGAAKALLRLGHETFTDRLIGILGAECDPVIVVVGHEAQTVLSGVDRKDDATFVMNPSYREGQLSSLQCGLRALPEDADGVMFTPVDYPAVAAGTITALARAFRERPDAVSIVVPSCEGRHGHPVCCARHLIREFLDLPPSGQARDVIRAHSLETIYVETGDAGILRDIDDREAYDRLVRDWQAK